jgi:LPPG:FO 2-phospho-L-lactate transferase
MGELHLQEFWVKYKGRPRVSDVRYNYRSGAAASRTVIDSLNQSQLILIAPANPVSSIGPIVALSDIRKALVRNRQKVIAISPLIKGKAITGPAIKYMRAIGLESSSVGVAKYYLEFVSKFVISNEDRSLEQEIGKLGMEVYETNTKMKTKRDAVRLASYLLKLVKR